MELKKRSLRWILLTWFVLCLAACSEPTPEPFPITPASFYTPPPTLIRTPTPTINPFLALIPEIGSLCENAHLAKKLDASIDLPVFLAYKRDYQDEKFEEEEQWRTYTIHRKMLPSRVEEKEFDHLLAIDPQDVATVACILESRKGIGRYTDGTIGYRLDFTVRFLKWPEGDLVEEIVLKGGKLTDSLPVNHTGNTYYTNAPVGDLVEFLLTRFPR